MASADWECRSPKAAVGRAPKFESPRPPCTPTKPGWLKKCEEECLRCPFPSNFILAQSSKREDRLLIECHGNDVMWAVFDGHRSHELSGHASKSFPSLVWNCRLWPSRPDETLRLALQECNERARRESLRGGSTAVIVASCGSHLWCCCAGDSRAVAGLVNGGVRRMSVDHTTEVATERDRVQAMGGRIEWGRLGGCLPMTRGLGNFDLEADGFACIPEVGCIPRWEVEFIVVASDGLW
ncbi:unnamed protein product, partial [Polarella glacialis]